MIRPQVMTNDQSRVEPVIREGLISTDGINHWIPSLEFRPPTGPWRAIVRHCCCGRTCVGLAISDAGRTEKKNNIGAVDQSIISDPSGSRDEARWLLFAGTAWCFVARCSFA